MEMYISINTATVCIIYSFTNMHTVIPAHSSSCLGFGTARAHLAPCHRPERIRTVMTCRPAPVVSWEIMGNSWEIMGKPREIMGKPWKFMGNLWENHGKMKAKPGGFSMIYLQFSWENDGTVLISNKQSGYNYEHYVQSRPPRDIY